MKRDFSKRKYIAAFLITIIIFILGVSLGLLFDSSNIQKINDANKKQGLDYVSLQLQYSFLDSSNGSCEVLKSVMYQNLLSLDKSLKEVSDITENNILSKEQFRLIQRQYTLDNLNYLLLNKRVKDKCNVDNIVVLYFYSEECISCPSQGTILTFFKNIFKDRVLIFPFNVDLDEPMINILKSKYNITNYPSLVVSDKKYEGIIEKENLLKIICKGFKNEYEECQIN